MKKLFFFIFSILFACACAGGADKGKESSNSISGEKVASDSVFVSGCYFVVDSGCGMARCLLNTDEIYFLDPKPIVGVCNFKDIEVVEDAFGKSAIVIGLDEKGTELFADATEKWIGKQIAMLISDTLYSAPVVNMRIEGGSMMVTNAGFDRKVCERLKRSMEWEKNRSLK